jgi:predicted RNase H-like HicB family nuclease
MEQRFTIHVAQYRDNGWFLGRVQELPGCCTRAPDLETLRINIVEAIQVYLETYKQLAATIPMDSYEVVRVP